MEVSVSETSVGNCSGLRSGADGALDPYLGSGA